MRRGKVRVGAWEMSGLCLIKLSIRYPFDMFARCVLLGAVFLLLAGTGTLSHARKYPIEGYPDGQSFTEGDVIHFHVSSAIERYHVVIERIGASRERVWERDFENGAKHPIPTDASSQGCGWCRFLSPCRPVGKAVITRCFLAHLMQLTKIDG